MPYFPEGIKQKYKKHSLESYEIAIFEVNYGQI